MGRKGSHAMPVFRIQPVSLSNGEFAPIWFDDERMLWDDERLHRPQAVLTTWQAPRLRLLKPRPTPVLFNPNAFAVSAEVRAVLEPSSAVEFLPIEIADHGVFFIIHVVGAVDVPPGTSLRHSPVSKNIIELFAFPGSYEPEAAFFRVAQPRQSAAGKGGFCLDTIYASAVGAQSIEEACCGYFRAVKITS